MHLPFNLALLLLEFYPEATPPTIQNIYVQAMFTVESLT